VPVVVVTNGESADVLDGETGKLAASGFDRIPSRDACCGNWPGKDFAHFVKHGRKWRPGSSTPLKLTAAVPVTIPPAGSHESGNESSQKDIRVHDSGA
jgi:hypothetical protein